MSRASMIIALIIIFSGIGCTVLGFIGIFPGAGSSQTDFAGQNREELFTFSSGQGMFTSYSIQVAITSSGYYDIEFRAVVSEPYTYGGYTFSTDEDIKTPETQFGAMGGSSIIYSLSGLTSQPLGRYPADIPVKYTVQVTTVSGPSPTYVVQQTFSNQTFLIAGIPLLLAGIAILVISIVRKPRQRTERAVPIVVSPTLGGFGYGGAGSGTGGVAIQSRGSGRGPKKKKKKRPTGRPVPKAGSAACPFCGKMVPSGAYYCPNCYSKIK